MDRRQESLTTKGAVQEPVKERQSSFPPPGEPPHEVAQVRGWTEDTGASRQKWFHAHRNLPLRGAYFALERPGKRRGYDREYKQQLRGQNGLTNSGQPPVRKAYICLEVPHLRLSIIPSRDGWFITGNLEE